MDKPQAYYEWLAIPMDSQPPNLYRLLSLNVFECSDVVIENAASKQIDYLQNYFFAGPFAEIAQEIQKEIASACKCLLDGEFKEKYDQDLAKKISCSTSDSVENAGEITTDSSEIKSFIENEVRSSIVLGQRDHWLIGADGQACDIVVDNEFVSSKHCILFRVGNEFELEDLESTNGTFVNRNRLIPRQRTSVGQRDLVTLGIKTFMPWPPLEV